MNVHEGICAVRRTYRHVRCAQIRACMHVVCMYAVHCVLMHRIVHLCAPALHLSTLVSMRHAHSIHLVCVGNLKVYVVNPIRKLCFELSNALLPPSHALYFQKCPSSENDVERIQLQVLK